MPMTRATAALVTTLGLFPLAALGQSSSNRTFKVHVKLTDMHPTVQQFAVSCELRQVQTNKICGTGNSGPQPMLPSGSFDGAVTVPISAGSCFGQPDRYKCSLTLPQLGYGTVPSSQAPLWAQPMPGAPFTPTIEGAL